MKQLPPAKLQPLTEGQLKALVVLLADEDQQVFETVRSRLLSHLSQAIPALRQATRSNDPLLRNRSSELITVFLKQDADTDFLRFCLTQGEEFDLEEAVFLLSKTGVPDANIAGYTALLESYAAVLAERLSTVSNGQQTLAVLNEFLFQELGYAGNEKNYYAPENSYLTCVMDNRTGNPISLCSFYMFLARRLHLPVVGIGLPGHFVCRYQSSTEEYYIDVFNFGKLLTKNDCIKYLVHTNHTLKEGFLLPMSARRILMRMCANLHQIYTEQKLHEDSQRLQRYLVALAK